MKTELLAPAKNKECAYAAINFGADAIYIGANYFGARKKASNSISDIEQIVNYAHKFYVKVYCTINTILNNDEIIEAKNLIKKLYDINVDGIIVQDMGLIELAINNEIPPIPIFASTQCDNRTLEKIKFLENIGLPRVILARELSIPEIENICSNTQTEIETFIHGALCVSYSGQCYLSQTIGGRSANRGECAQPCRKTYTLIDEDNNIIAKNQYLLSLKDFNASKHVQKLVNIGVSSFKIEGRLKDKNYVKNVVAFYRNLLDKYSSKTSSGKVFLDFEPDVNKSFNRGFTDYFLDKRKVIYNFETPKSIGENIGIIEKVYNNHFIIKNHNLKAQDGLYFNGFGCLVNKVEGEKIFPNKMDEIKVGLTVYRNYDSEFEKKLQNSKTKRQISTDIEIFKDKITITDENNNTAFVKIQTKELAKNQEKIQEIFKKQFNKTGESYFYCNSIDIKSSELPFLPISEINELRRQLFDKLMQNRLKNYPKTIQNPLKYSTYPIKEMDYKANVHNDFAKNFYDKCQCNIIETSLESGTTLDKKPIMTTKHCLKYAFNLCKKNVNLFLIDEKNKKYPLKFDCKNCTMQIFNS